MKKYTQKLLSVLFTVGSLMICSHLSASEHEASFHSHCDKSITFASVAGTYQINGFSNSFPGATSLIPAESQAAVGQIVFNKDGTGVVTFVDFTVILANGTFTSTHFTDVNFTYTLGPINGYGTLTLQDFPISGVDPVFAISFKKHHHKVEGFSAVTTGNTTSSLWTLLQGERFN